MEIDLNADLDNMDVEDLLAYQQEITRARLDVLDAGRRVQKVLDYWTQEIAERRRREDALLGQKSKPPTQHVFGEPEEQAEPTAVESAPSGILRKGDG